MEIKLFGWTMEQWSIVCARFPLKEYSHSGALEARKQWKLSSAYEPGEERLIGIEPARDWDAVGRMTGLMWQVGNRTDAAA